MLAPPVRGEHVDQARQQRGAHCAEVGGERIGQCDGVGVELPAHEFGGIEKRERDRFAIIARSQLSTQGVFVDARFTRCGNANLAGGHRGRNPIVAVYARDFLDQIFLDRDIEAARRRRGAPALCVCFDMHVERGEDAQDFVVRHLDAKHATQTRAAQRLRLRAAQEIAATWLR